MPRDSDVVADFVLCTADFAVIGIIELDDSTLLPAARTPTGTRVRRSLPQATASCGFKSRSAVALRSHRSSFDRPIPNADVMGPGRVVEALSR